jgi:hypothetical protein
MPHLLLELCAGHLRGPPHHGMARSMQLSLGTPAGAILLAPAHQAPYHMTLLTLQPGPSPGQKEWHRLAITRDSPDQRGCDPHSVIRVVKGELQGSLLRGLCVVLCLPVRSTPLDKLNPEPKT